MCQMPAYLMSSPGEQLDFKKAISACWIPSGTVERLFGLCQDFVFTLGLLKFARPLTSERVIVQSFFFHRNASNDAAVGFLNFPFHKHALQLGKDLFVFGKKQAATRGSIQPMNWCYPVVKLITKLNEGILVFTKSLPRAVHKQPSRLVDNYQMFVFKEDI